MKRIFQMMMSNLFSISTEFELRRKKGYFCQFFNTDTHTLSFRLLTPPKPKHGTTAKSGAQECFHLVVPPPHTVVVAPFQSHRSTCTTMSLGCTRSSHSALTHAAAHQCFSRAAEIDNLGCQSFDVTARYELA